MLPQVRTLQNYYEVFVRWPFPPVLLNSLLVSGVSTVMILLTSSSAGYAFAKIKSRWLNVISSSSSHDHRALRSLYDPGLSLVNRWVG